jgi:hypothetical protein
VKEILILSLEAVCTIKLIPASKKQKNKASHKKGRDANPAKAKSDSDKASKAKVLKRAANPEKTKRDSDKSAKAFELKRAANPEKAKSDSDKSAKALGSKRKREREEREKANNPYQKSEIDLAHEKWLLGSGRDRFHDRDLSLNDDGLDRNGDDPVCTSSDNETVRFI